MWFFIALTKWQYIWKIRILNWNVKPATKRHLAVIVTLVVLCLSENSVVYKKFVSSKPPSRSDYWKRMPMRQFAFLALLFHSWPNPTLIHLNKSRGQRKSEAFFLRCRTPATKSTSTPSPSFDFFIFRFYFEIEFFLLYRSSTWSGPR